MASNDIRRFHFENLDQYLWQAGDFLNFQTWVDATIAAISEGSFGAAVLSGLLPTASGGLNVSIAPGICVNSTGRLMFNPAPVSVTVASDPSNPVNHLIVIRPVDVDMDTIPKPTNPLVNIALDKQLSFQVVVIAGTPNATPLFPPPQPGDVIVAGVSVPTAAVSLTISNFHRSVIDTKLPKKYRSRTVGANYSAATGDEIIEGAATGGNITITLPTAATMAGQKLDIVKVDSTTNSVIISGNGGELISGQASQSLDDQWQTLTMFANFTGWRVLT